MTDAALKVLREFGFPTLVAVALGFGLGWIMLDASKERAAHTSVLVDQLSDLREKVAKLEACCK